MPSVLTDTRKPCYRKNMTILNEVPTGTRIVAMYYGSRRGVVVKETRTRVWIEFKMIGKNSRSVVRPYLKAAQQSSPQSLVQLGEWAVDENRGIR